MYAALKEAETALLQTVWEIFKNSKLKWFHSIFPRLSGGLGSNSNISNSDTDYNLIGAEIEKIINNLEQSSIS